MKCVILAGGLGTRLSEETTTKPKPMVEIGGKPILWHIMKMYSLHGVHEFIICAGYKGYVIKEYFANYFLHMSDITFDLNDNSQIIHKKKVEPWKITIVDTGSETMTGGRLKRISDYLTEDNFCMTYGDGVSDVNIRESINFHKKHGKLATVTAVKAPGRFGSLGFSNDDSLLVNNFMEKPVGDGFWINGGFFVLNKKCLNYITKSDATIWEKEPLEQLAKDGQLMSYKHTGFWKPMDTLRDKNQLEDMYTSNNAKWKNW